MSECSLPSNHNTTNNNDINETTLTLVKKLRLELQKKDEEITKLKNSVNFDDVKCITCNNIAEVEIRADPSDDVDLPSDSHVTNTHNDIYKENMCILEKETLFCGQNADDKPCPNNVVQIHYTITSIPNNNTSDIHKINVEDSRERRNGQPFEFILGHGQVIKEWEMIVQQMCRGEVTSIKMKLDSNGDDCFLPPSMTSSSPLLDSNVSNHEFTCRIELIDFWKYDQPFRPWIVKLE